MRRAMMPRVIGQYLWYRPRRGFEEVVERKSFEEEDRTMDKSASNAPVKKGISPSRSPP